MKELLYYDCLVEFNSQYYGDLLTARELQSGEVNISTLRYTSGAINENANFWGYVFEKNNKKFLLPAMQKINGESVRINLRELLPIRPSNVVKVASKGTVYHLIQDPVSFRIRPEKTMSFKQLIDMLTSLNHSNSRGIKLLWMLGLTQLFNRANFRLSSPAGTGKDSVVDMLGNLIGGCTTIESPSYAKLEERASVLQYLAVNEVVDMEKADWRNVQQFLLATGAFKPKVTKHTRAFKGVQEEIDIGNFSLSLMYNDIDHYPDHSNYFDYVTKEQVLDRFPAFRFYGTYTENFGTVSQLNVPEFVEKNMSTYVELIRALLYWSKEIVNSKYPYTVEGKSSSRSKVNLGRLYNTISHYCESEGEFKSWMDYAKTCHEDYYTQMSFVDVYEKLRKKLSDKELQQELKIIRKMNNCPFKDKLKYMHDILEGNKQYNDVPMESLW